VVYTTCPSEADVLTKQEALCSAFGLHHVCCNVHQHVGGLHV
jgi:hypothetical protein